MPVVTLDSLRKSQKKPDRGDASDEEAGGNEYYTGGAGQGGTGSGLAVLAPNDRGPAGGDPLRQAMDRIQRDQSERGGAVAPVPNRRLVNVRVFRNGFIVDNGPLRTLDKPENQAFMESLVEGYCPQELIENGQAADVKLENKMDEDYDPRASSSNGRPGRQGAVPAPGFSAFTGTGSAVGDIALSATPGIVPGTQGNGAPLIVNETAGDVVRVQIKFPDGAREVAKFEKSHTVRHLIARVELLRPALRPYHLLSGNRGPPKPIEASQFDETLVNAGLANALVTVREL